MNSRAGLDEQHLADALDAARALATRVADDLQRGLETRGTASLVVSGGKSPLPFFSELRTRALDWANVTVTLADERWVATDHPDSNERLLREHLLVEAARSARLVGLKNDADTPASASARAATWRALAAMRRPFDAVVLGMGADGHTASLFPGMPGLRDAVDADAPAHVVAGVAPSEPRARISLNLSALLESRRLYLPLQGAAKHAVYRAARDQADAMRHPVAAVLAQRRVPVVVQLIEG